MDVVMDVHILDEVCRNNKKVLELLEKIKNHRVKDILLMQRDASLLTALF